jgi:hypothetical protein
VETATAKASAAAAAANGHGDGDSKDTIGVYTRGPAGTRATLLQKFKAKREARLWKRNVRYSCRKNLADSRVRVKGRFVRADVLDIANLMVAF